MPPGYNVEVRNRFYKGHGLGNDYLVFEEGTDVCLDEDAIVRICDRWRGVGSDGVVLLVSRSGPPFQLRMFNPDGSEFERSGNGLRILASYLMKENLIGEGSFEVSVGGDLIRLEVINSDSRGHYDIRVDMGNAKVGAEWVGFDDSALDSEGRLELKNGGNYEINLVSMGNPHCVIFLDNWDTNLLEEIGPILCGHKAFKKGTNVQLAKVLDDDLIEVLIWERGVGVTSASGTSACAVAVAAVHSGRVCSGTITVQMEGGSLEVSVDDENRVVLRGPVQEVFWGRLTDGFTGLVG